MASASGALRQAELGDSEGDFATLFKACGKAKSLHQARRAHAAFVRSGKEPEVYLSNLLVQMYGRCGAVDEAKKVFDGMQRRNAFSWSLMLNAYVHNDGHGNEALVLYKAMCRNGMEFACAMFVGVLSACSSLGDLEQGRAVHRKVVESRVKVDVFLATSLVTMYGRCGCVQEAARVFQLYSSRNVVMWNAMIAAYAQNGHHREAVDLYHSMNVEPNQVTLIIILDSCSDVADVEEGKKAHQRLSASGFGLKPWNALVNMYAKCGRIQQAREVFGGMQQRDVVTWTTMIAACVQNGQSAEALELYHKMDVEPNQVTYASTLQACASLGRLDKGRSIHRRAKHGGFSSNLTVAIALIDMYGKCSSPEEAAQVFAEAIVQFSASIVLWNVMISAYAQCGRLAEARGTFWSMEREGVGADSTTIVVLLGICCARRELEEGTRLHRRVSECGISQDVVLSTAILTMYSKCGNLRLAKEAFDRDNSVSHRLASCNAMMAAYIENGEAKSALRLFEGMSAPNEISFITALKACADPRPIHRKLELLSPELLNRMAVSNSLVSAYGRCGQLGEARRVFESMQVKDTVSWNAMVSVTSQLGLYREAVVVYSKMLLDGASRPDWTTFVAVLDACAMLGDLTIGRMVHDHIVASGLESVEVVSSALVNVYAKCGSPAEAMDVFHGMLTRDRVAWTAMISSYALEDHVSGCQRALDLFARMVQDGVMPDEVTLGCIVFACAHAGSLKPGTQCFVSMSVDYGQRATFEHYTFMVDLLARAGRLDEAEELLGSMPFHPDLCSFHSLLSACATLGNVAKGVGLAHQVLAVDPGNENALIFLSKNWALQSQRL